MPCRVELTALMMIAKVVGGWLFKSMALLAYGWHMNSHALALGLRYWPMNLAGDTPTTNDSS